MANNIKLYCWSTPNGEKITLFLELLKIPYEIVKVDISAGEQKKPEYLAMNPNGKIPTLQDSSTGVTISETAAILTYLADNYDLKRQYSFEYKTVEYYKQTELLYFQMANIGPAMGTLFHFMHQPEKHEPTIAKFMGDVKRILGVLNEYLSRNSSGFLVGDKLSIADLCTIPFVMPLPFLGLSYKDYPEVLKWIKKLIDMPEIRAGFYKLGDPLFWPTEDMF